MPTQRFSTNLRCEGCVAAIKPALDAAPGIKSWSADVSSPDKIITVESDGKLTLDAVNALLNKVGYQAKAEVTQPSPTIMDAEPPTSYYPLLLILLYLLGIVAAIEWAQGTFHWERAMRHFMAGFFLVFSFFKLLNLTAFADSYQMYDIVAKRSRFYALAYPFIELLLGLAYLIDFQPRVTNIVTLIVMGVSTIGVVQSILSKKKIRCACLGAVFNLPMSVVTLVEDLLMVGMAAVMLLG
ncbi:MAG TPA: copper chaperone [Gemmatales bacterium]|nr:copper chaperone [Gemmatales bacterium]